MTTGKKKQIKILAITAHPGSMDPGPYEKEQEVFLDAFSAFERCDLFLELPDPVKSTMGEIHAGLKTGDYDVLVLSLEVISDKKGAAVVACEGEDGLLEEIPLKKFAKELLVCTPRLVILTSPFSHRRELVLSELAKVLHGAGLRAVIAMNRPLSAEAFVEFNRGLFGGLLKKKNITEAFAMALEMVRAGEGARLLENPDRYPVDEASRPQLLVSGNPIARTDFSDGVLDYTGKSRENRFTGKRDLLRQVFMGIAKGDKVFVLKGESGTGKSTLLEQMATRMKKKKYNVIPFRGEVSAEIFLKRLAEHAQQSKVPEVENLFTKPSQYKEKLEKLLAEFIYKQKLLLVFEDFEKNQESDGTFRNERLKELLTFLKDTLMEKEAAVVMLFSTQYEIPKFPVVEVGLFSWVEFRKLVFKTEWLKGLDNKSLLTLYFEMGGYPRVVPMLEQIARAEFPAGTFNWPELRDRIPQLSERVLHKESEGADFSYLLLEALWGLTDETLRLPLEILSVYRGFVPKEALAAHGHVIKPEIRKELELGYGVRFVDRHGDNGHEVGFLVPPFVSGWVRGQMAEGVLAREHGCAATYFAAGKDDESLLQARWHYLQAGMIEQAAHLTFSMDPHYCSFGYPQFAFDLLKDLEKYAGDMSTQNQLYFHGRLGVMGAMFGRWDEALQHYEEALKLTAPLGQTQQEPLILGQMARIYEAKNKDDEALTHFERALAAFAGLGEDASEMVAIHLDQMGAILKRQGHYEEAFEKVQKALTIYTVLNHRKGMGVNMEQLGRIFDEQGKFDEAMDYYHRSLVEREALGNQAGMAVLLHQMGNVNFVQGKLDMADEFYQKALVLNESLGDFRSAGYSRGQIGLIQQRQGHIDEALAHFEKSLVDFENSKEEKGMASGFHQVGRIYQGKGERERALEHYLKALDLREKIGDTLGMAITYGQLGILFYEKEEWETALRYSTQSYAIFSRYGSPNAELSKQNMIRLHGFIPADKFNEILKEYHINTGKE